MAAKILILDIETSPILGYVWGPWENNLSPTQIKQDWRVLSWAAKWLEDPVHKVVYKDQRKAKDIQNDKDLLKGIWDLLDEADILITQNGKQFDVKKLNARFIQNGFTPPSPYRHIDTKQLAKKMFGFTYNSLEYMSDKLCVKFKKLKHPKYSGFELWKECLAGNVSAWEEMKKYNIHDVLATEELYTKLAPWGTGIDFGAYGDGVTRDCNCGSRSLSKRGFSFTQSGKYQRYQCKDCGAWMSSKQNLLSVEQRKAMLKK